MTGPGTNTYIIGTEDLAVIDPGPAIDEHIEHILKVGDGRISHILCTHTHPDHSPAAAHLARELGVPMIGAVTADDQHQDLTFQPDVHLQQDAVFSGRIGQSGRFTPPATSIITTASCSRKRGWSLQAITS